MNADSVEVGGTAATDNIPSLLISATLQTGDAGDLEINTRILRLRDGASILAGTTGDGMGGELIVNASEVVEVKGTGANGFPPSRLSTESGLEGFASNPFIQEFEQFGVDLSQATGDSGNLRITTRAVDRARWSTGSYCHLGVQEMAGEFRYKPTPSI